jgi:cytoskeletal protein CcmA (bactofilin family)
MTISLRKTALLIIALLLLTLVVGVGVAGAQSFQSGDNLTIAKGQRVDSTLWVSGRNVDIAGTVAGDVFCAGQNVTISGTVDGDVICAAQTIRIAGSVKGNVRLAGQTVTISGDVSHNSSIAAQTFSLEASGRVAGDAGVAANDVNLNGAIGRDVAVTARTVSLGGNVGREVKATTEHLQLNANARVGGNLSYTSANKANLTAGATIAGTTNHYQPAKTANHRNRLFGFSWVGAVYTIIALLIVALAGVLLLPQLFQEVSGVAMAAPFKTLLVGVVALFAFPVVFIAILLTVFGIPLALLLLLGWLLILAFSGLFFSYYIGRLLLKQQPNPIIIMLVGALVVLVLHVIPIVGLIVGAVALWMGTGMALLSLKRQFVRPHYLVPER